MYSKIISIKPKTTTLLILLTCLIVAPTQASLSFAHFTRKPSLWDMAISPNGQYLAQLWGGKNTEFLIIKDISKPDAPEVSRFTVDRAQTIRWANNDKVLAKIFLPLNDLFKDKSPNFKSLNKFKGFRRYSRVFAFDIHNKSISYVRPAPTRQLHTNEDMSDIHNYLINDKDHILMSANRGGRKTLYKVNLNTGKSEFYLSGSKSTIDFISDRNGEVHSRIDFREYKRRLTIYNLQSNKWKKIDSIVLSKEEINGLDTEAVVGLFGTDIVYRKDNDSTGYKELYIYDRKLRQFRPFVNLPNQDILGVVSFTNTKEIAGYSVLNDVVRFKLFDKKQQSKYDKLAKHVGEYNFDYVTADEDNKKQIILTYGQDNPGSYYFYDSTKNTFEFMQYKFKHTPIDTLAFPARAYYKTRDDVKIRTYILLPPNYKRGEQFPLVVLPHGGPQARDYANYDDFAQFIATRGYIVIQPNFRGSTGYGKKFEVAGYKQWGQRMQEDIEDATRFMIEKGYADPKKICIAGISFGGYAALMGPLRARDLYQCSISINGVTHLGDIIKFDRKNLDDKKLTTEYLYKRIGHPKRDKTMLEQNSPALLANNFSIPTLLIASENDQVVPARQTKSLVKELKKLQKTYKFIELENARHNPFLTSEDTNKVYREVEAFLEKYLE